MAIDAEGRWIPDLYPKQFEVLQACMPGPQNMVLINGPRWSGKTVSLFNAIPNIAWNTDRGNICMLTITQSAGVDSGPWQHLTEVYLPQWIHEGNFGLEWVKEPYVQSVTKKPACRVTNKYGNSTLISLESLKNEDEVEQRFKGKAYSCIWVNELSKFKKRKTFDTLKQCLRMPHLREEEHLFVADTNPDLDLGQESPWYKLWYEFRTASQEDLERIYPDIPSEHLLPLQRKLKLIEFTIDDNLSLSDQKKAELMADFSHDPDLLKAYYYGLWVTASADALFFKVFRPLVHVVGEASSPVNDDPEILVPTPGTIDLYTGWDPGAAVNSAAVIGAKRYRTEIKRDEKGKEVEHRVPIIDFIDELVIVDTPHDLADFVFQFMEKMLWWEEFLGRTGKIIWHHWSDRSVLDMKSAESAKFFHQIIFEASGGTINLMAADRGPGSVGQRVDLYRKLLFDERLFYSREKCPHLINAVKSLKRGKNEIAVIAKGQKFKHPWDASSYLVASEMYSELNRSVMETLLRPKKGRSTLVTVDK